MRRQRQRRPLQLAPLALALAVAGAGAARAPLLRGSNLHVTYSGGFFGGGRTEALKGVDVEVKEGINIVVGYSGAGKSTLLQALSGRLPLQPESGPVDLAADAVLKVVDPELRKSRASFAELMETRAGAHDLAAAFALDAKAQAALQTPLRDVPMSLGAYLALCIDCADVILGETEEAVGEPHRLVAVLDEYVDKEDVRVSKAFWTQVQRLTTLHAPRVAVLAVTHQVETAREFADSAIFLARGSLLQQVPPGELIYDGKTVGRL